MRSASKPGVLVGPNDLHEQLPRPHAPNRLAHIVFKTPRPQDMIDWYTRTLDAVVVFRNKRVAFLTYDEEHHRIAFVSVPPRAIRLPSRGWKLHRKVFGVDHIAFTYSGLQSLVVNYRRLADMGINRSGASTTAPPRHRCTTKIPTGIGWNCRRTTSAPTRS